MLKSWAFINLIFHHHHHSPPTLLFLCFRVTEADLEFLSIRFLTWLRRRGRYGSPEIRMIRARLSAGSGTGISGRFADAIFHDINAFIFTCFQQFTFLHYTRQYLAKLEW